MSQRTVFCQKLKKEAPALAYVPYPGALGQRIYGSICQQAWQLWLTHQTLLINENRLYVLDPNARLFIEAEMEKFFFTGDSEKPKGYVPVE